MSRRGARRDHRRADHRRPRRQAGDGGGRLRRGRRPRPPARWRRTLRRRSLALKRQRRLQVPGSTSRAGAPAGCSRPRSVDRPAELLASRSDAEIDSREAAPHAAMLGRMLAHEPLSRIIGRREFWGLEFVLSADTLDPRPESETVVEAVLARLPDRSGPYRLLDLGTGTGCLLLAAACRKFPPATGIGIDIAPGAVADGAAQRGRPRSWRAARGFLVGDWAEALSARFAAVVANPPYIASAALVRPAARSKPLRSLARSRRRRGRARSLPRDRRRPARVCWLRRVSSRPRSGPIRPMSPRRY